MYYLITSVVIRIKTKSLFYTISGYCLSTILYVQILAEYNDKIRIYDNLKQSYDNFLINVVELYNKGGIIRKQWVKVYFTKNINILYKYCNTRL